MGLTISKKIIGFQMTDIGTQSLETIKKEKKVGCWEVGLGESYPPSSNLKKKVVSNDCDYLFECFFLSRLLKVGLAIKPIYINNIKNKWNVVNAPRGSKLPLAGLGWIKQSFLSFYSDTLSVCHQFHLGHFTCQSPTILIRILPWPSTLNFSRTHSS